MKTPREKFLSSDDWSVNDLGGGKERVRGKIVGDYANHDKFHVPPLDDMHYTVVLEPKKKRIGRFSLKLMEDEYRRLNFKMGEAVDVIGDDPGEIDGKKNILLNVKRT